LTIVAEFRPNWGARPIIERFEIVGAPGLRPNFRFFPAPCRFVPFTVQFQYCPVISLANASSIKIDIRNFKTIKKADRDVFCLKNGDGYDQIFGGHSLKSSPRSTKQLGL
jgi:hypothetical protein